MKVSEGYGGTYLFMELLWLLKAYFDLSFPSATFAASTWADKFFDFFGTTS